MEGQILAGIFILSASVMVLLFLFFKMKSRVKELESKYSNIIKIDVEVEKAKKEKESLEQQTDVIRNEYKQKRAVFENLVKEAAIYDEEIQLAELGFYKPHFDFDTSERYKEEISLIKQEQKGLLATKQAIYCEIEWTTDGSKAKGRTMTNRNIKLTARAFNNECDAAIANTRWNNVERMEQRIGKAYGSINKLNQSNRLIISHEYYTLKIKELRLAHEYAEKKQQEKEEQQEIRRQMREETKLEQEVEKVLKEEERYSKLLEKAKREAEATTGSKLDSLNEKILQLSEALKEAHEKSERAKSMAEQTKRGHVYIVSNIGSFGENIYKIGMTRRLEPLDRVKELGDASVPFTFDIHAIIHSENAPELEKSLHKIFDQNRLNLVNSRKEFFQINLADIESEVKKLAPDSEFIETPEARDYRESQSIIAQRDKTKTVDAALDAFPETI